MYTCEGARVCMCVQGCYAMKCPPASNSGTKGLTHNVRLLEGRLWGSYCYWLEVMKVEPHDKISALQEKEGT